MTAVAVRAVPHVPADALVARTGLGLCVAYCANEDLEIGPIGVAIAARGGGAVRNSEPGVVESRAGPSRRRMTVLTRGGKPRRRMDGVGRVVVVLLVTGNACRGLACIHAVAMTLRARDREMRAGQREPRGGMVEPRP